MRFSSGEVRLQLSRSALKQLKSQNQRQTISRETIPIRVSQNKPYRAFSSTHTRNIDDEKDAEQNFSVRYFEQEEDGRRTEIPDRPFDLKHALQGLHDAMETQEQKEAFQKVARAMGNSLSQTSTSEELRELVTKMDAYTASIDAKIKLAGADLPSEVMEELLGDPSDLSFIDATEGSQAPAYQIPENKPWNMNQRKKIKTLNLLLARAAHRMKKDPKFDKKTVSAVYKAYFSARLALAHSWSSVPSSVWDLLWSILSADESVNVHRMAHLSLLSRDMSEAKITLAPQQQLLAIEATFFEGWEPQAIESWKRCTSTLGDKGSDYFQDFWKLGVRMYCRVGDLDRAERAAQMILERQQNARILMPLIRTFSEQGTLKGREKAWAAYRQMRTLLGKEMVLEDYDMVISFFLATNQTENALCAFVDMMFDGEIDLKQQQKMPSVIANKFFLGKWLKRLIGYGDLRGAYNVVKFMRERGVEAAPIQLNGLIGAWQRSGGADDVKLAENLAWEMIDSRIAHVRTRHSKDDSGGVDATVSHLIARPRATLETFCLIAENYRTRGLHSDMMRLLDASREAEIGPDTFMMNQLLESYIRAGQGEEAVRLYRFLLTERGVTPDPHTFSALWKLLGINRLHVVPQESLPQEIYAARCLFAEMVQSKSAFAGEGIDGQLARKILHSFRHLGDAVGFIVALRALQQLLHFVPPELLVLELTIGTMRLAWDTAPQRRRLLVAKRDIDRRLRAEVGGDEKQLEGSLRGEALCRVLQEVYWPKNVTEEDSRQLFVEASRQMGVEGLFATS